MVSSSTTALSRDVAPTLSRKLRALQSDFEKHTFDVSDELPQADKIFDRLTRIAKLQGADLTSIQRDFVEYCAEHADAEILEPLVKVAQVLETSKYLQDAKDAELVEASKKIQSLKWLYHKMSRKLQEARLTCKEVEDSQKKYIEHTDERRAIYMNDKRKFLQDLCVDMERSLEGLPHSAVVGSATDSVQHLHNLFRLLADFPDEGKYISRILDDRDRVSPIDAVHHVCASSPDSSAGLCPTGVAAGTIVRHGQLRSPLNSPCSSRSSDRRQQIAARRTARAQRNARNVAIFDNSAHGQLGEPPPTNRSASSGEFSVDYHRSTFLRRGNENRGVLAPLRSAAPLYHGDDSKSQTCMHRPTARQESQVFRARSSGSQSQVHPRAPTDSESSSALGEDPRRERERTQIRRGDSHAEGFPNEQMDDEDLRCFQAQVEQQSPEPARCEPEMVQDIHAPHPPYEEPIAQFLPCAQVGTPHAECEQALPDTSMPLHASRSNCQLYQTVGQQVLRPPHQVSPRDGRSCQLRLQELGAGAAEPRQPEQLESGRVQTQREKPPEAQSQGFFYCPVSEQSQDVEFPQYPTTQPPSTFSDKGQQPPTHWQQQPRLPQWDQQPPPQWEQQTPSQWEQQTPSQWQQQPCLPQWEQQPPPQWGQQPPPQWGQQTPSQWEQQTPLQWEQQAKREWEPQGPQDACLQLGALRPPARPQDCPNLSAEMEAHEQPCQPICSYDAALTFTARPQEGRSTPLDRPTAADDAIASPFTQEPAQINVLHVDDGPCKKTGSPNLLPHPTSSRSLLATPSKRCDVTLPYDTCESNRQMEVDLETRDVPPTTKDELVSVEPSRDRPPRSQPSPLSSPVRFPAPLGGSHMAAVHSAPKPASFSSVLHSSDCPTLYPPSAPDMPELREPQGETEWRKPRRSAGMQLPEQHTSCSLRAPPDFVHPGLPEQSSSTQSKRTPSRKCDQPWHVNQRTLPSSDRLATRARTHPKQAPQLEHIVAHQFTPSPSCCPLGSPCATSPHSGATNPVSPPVPPVSQDAAAAAREPSQEESVTRLAICRGLVSPCAPCTPVGQQRHVFVRASAPCQQAQLAQVPLHSVSTKPFQSPRDNRVPVGEISEASAATRQGDAVPLAAEPKGTPSVVGTLDAQADSHDQHCSHPSWVPLLRSRLSDPSQRVCSPSGDTPHATPPLSTEVRQMTPPLSCEVRSTTPPRRSTEQAPNYPRSKDLHSPPALTVGLHRAQERALSPAHPRSHDLLSQPMSLRNPSRPCGETRGSPLNRVPPTDTRSASHPLEHSSTAPNLQGRGRTNL